MLFNNIYLSHNVYTEEDIPTLNLNSKYLIMCENHYMGQNNTTITPCSSFQEVIALAKSAHAICTVFERIGNEAKYYKYAFDISSEVI